MKITINEGSAFLISDEYGNVNKATEQGFYFEDTRFLNYYEMLINGERPHYLTSGKVNYYVARHFLSNPIISKEKDPSSIFERPDTLSIIRTQIVENGLHEDLEIQNFSEQPINFELSFLFDGDFADIFEVKRQNIVKKGTVSINVDSEQQWIVRHYIRDKYSRWLGIKFEIPFPVLELHHNRVVYRVDLQPKEKFHTCTIFYPGTNEAVPVTPSYTCLSFNVLEAMKKDRSEEWLEAAPNIKSDNDDLERAYIGAIKAMGSLRLHDKAIGEDTIIPAAGIPWFVTFFGRDSLIASFQSIMNRRELAMGTIRTLARFQGKKFNDYSEEEPGKILHEIRFGELASLGEIPHTPYYGTVDATPLFLILISEIYLWTGDKKFLHQYMDNIKDALNWIDEFGDKDGDGYIEYINKSRHGLENQGWKDSFNAVRFADGRLAEAPIALSEVQGYVYDAKKRMTRIFEDLGDTALAGKLRLQAIELKAKFNRDFWMPEVKFFAEGLDKNKDRINSLTSNAGQLLWSGILDDEKKKIVIERLLKPDMFSGWGVRTLSTDSVGYNPLGYHNGTVWPHDNSLIAWGMRISGGSDYAVRIISSMLEACSHFEDHVLPELFCGFERTKKSFPVEYPTSSQPQAWAAGAVILFMRTMLGLEVDVPAGIIKISPMLPETVSFLRLTDIKIADEIIGIEMRREGNRTVTSLVQEPKRLEIIISSKQ